MFGKAVRRHPDDIETAVQMRKRRMTRLEKHQGAEDTPLLARADRLQGLRLAGPCLHFDGADRAAAPGDDVDLATWCAITPRKDAVEFQPQQQHGARFGVKTAKIGLTPVWTLRALQGVFRVRRVSASARA